MTGTDGPGPPPERLAPFGEIELPAGTRVWRVFSRERPARAFNPCRGTASRFAPLYRPDGGCIPTLYAGETETVALLETVFRDLPPRPLPRLAREARLAAVSSAVLELRRGLLLAPLFNQNLALLGLTRASLIACHGSAAYARTARRAEAIHRDRRDLDGLAWTSRQQDDARAFLLFGERVASADLLVVAHEPIDQGEGRARLAALAGRFGIDIIPG